jgi:N-acetylneuraminic acid mutarotase
LLEDRCVLTPVVSVLPIAPRSGVPFQGAVATFTDPANPGAAPGSFSAAINWGDGTGTDTITPTITFVNGQFTVNGSHTYAAAGSDTLTVTVTDNAGNFWTTQANMPITGYGLAAATGPDGQLYVFGGFSGSSGLLSGVEAYNPVTNSWTAKADMPIPRHYLAAAPGPDGQIYTFGGTFISSGFLPTVEAYNPATDSWTTKADMPTARRALAAAAGPDGQLYVFGGFNFSGGDLATVEAYNPATNSWTTKASMPTRRDALAAAPGPDGLIYVLGGISGGSGLLSTVDAYNPATNSWTTKADMPTARYGLAAATGPDGQLYAFGGTNFVAGIHGLNTAEAYDPVTNSWTTKASMPTPREDLAAATAPDGRIFAFGGLNNSSILSTTEAYLPAGLSGIGSHSIRVSARHPDRVGAFHGDSTWTLDLGSNGSNPVTFVFGKPGDQGIVGDWNGAGFDAVGTVRVAANAFAPDGKHALLVSLDYNGDRTWDSGDVSFYFGEEGDQIVLGDWNGDGKTKLGVVRPDGAGSLSWSLDFTGDHTLGRLPLRPARPHRRLRRLDRRRQGQDRRRARRCGRDAGRRQPPAALVAG